MTDARKGAEEWIASFDKASGIEKAQYAFLCVEALRSLLAETDGALDAATYGAWKAAALRVGEEMASTGPDGYYYFGPSAWREWALSRLVAIRRNELPTPAAPPAADEVREAATRYATQPDRRNNGVPYCSEQCPQHDGKRCRILGGKPDGICEPEVLNLLAALAARGKGE